MCNKAEERIENIAKCDLEINEKPGPLVDSVKNILTENRIKEQAYYGGTMTGNHCHRYFKGKVYEKITDELQRQTHLHTSNTSLQAQAYRLKQKFNRLNKSLGLVHEALSHTQKIDQISVLPIQKLIDNYIEHYKLCFGRLTPKHHILQHHCLPFIKRYGAGLGLLGEQGVEASHQTISKISARSLGINNEVEKLRFIMNTHILDASPSIYSWSN